MQHYPGNKMLFSWMQDLRQGIRQMGMSRCNLNIMAATTASWLEPGAGDINLGESVTGMTNPLLFHPWSKLIILAYECCGNVLTSTFIWKMLWSFDSIFHPYHCFTNNPLHRHRPSIWYAWSGVTWGERERSQGLRRRGRQGRSHHTKIITVIDIIVLL